jgi:hypothetical protein
MKFLLEKTRGLEVWVIAILVAVVLLVAFAASGYLSRWLGSIGQVATGALIGWVVSRRLMKLNVSEYTEPLHRCLAGLGQALVISAGMIGVGVAV